MRPRRLIHRGVIAASGFITERRERVLALWEPGASLRRIGGGWLVRLPRPRTVHTYGAPGLPLVDEGGTLWSAPLTVRERAALAAPAGTVVRVRGGVAAVEPPGEPEDPARWLDLEAFQLLPAAPLGEVAAPAHVALAPPVVERAAYRIDEAPPERESLMRALAGLEPEPRARRGGGLIGRLRGLFRIGRAAAAETGRFSPRRWLAHVISWFRLGGLIGRRQAAYLAETLELLRSGDLDEGLRRAVPLSAADSPPSTGPLLGLPSPRPSLAISLSPPRPGPSVGVVSEVFSDIGALYRSIFARLARDGDIDRAAFVLEELLGEHASAVAFLEKHGRLRLAAELAEARGLPPGLVIRLWFLARDRDRAMRIAVLSGAFADAILRLERGHPDEGVALRIIWADRLAAGGDYAAAIETIAPLGDARDRARAWIDAALEAGGASAARLLPLWLRLAPDDHARVRDRAVALLADDGGSGPDERRAFLHALAAEAPRPTLAPLARAGVRALVREGRDDARLRDRLLALAGDSALRADLPPAGPAPAAVAPPEVIELSARDRGTLAIHDVARLPSGRLLVALGELGARLLAPDGRTLASFAAPARRLVAADHGSRALALVWRGDVVRVTPLDLVSRRAGRPFETPCDDFAATTDGDVWFIAHGDAVLGLELAAPEPRARWRVGDLGGQPSLLARDQRWLSFAVSSPDGESELWTYELAGMTLRSRTPCSAMPLAVSPAGMPAVLLGPESLLVQDGPKLSPLDGPTGAVELGSSFIVVDDCNPHDRTVCVRRSSGARTTTVRLGGARSLSVHLRGNTLTLADDLGRILAIDLETGARLADIRLHTR